MKNKMKILTLLTLAVYVSCLCGEKHYNGIVDYLRDVSKGNVPGEFIINKFGSTKILTTSTDSQTVWPGKGFYKFTPDTARSLEAVSTSANDSGSIRMSGTATGGNRTSLIDRNVNFIDSNVSIKDIFINNETDEYAVIIAVDSNELTLLEMSNHSEIEPKSTKNKIGDSYKIMYASGEGAGAIMVFGLDSNWYFQNEIIILKGLDTVDLVKKYIRQWHSFVITGGTYGGAKGNIIVRDSGGGGDTACIIIDGANQAQQAFFTIPCNRKGYLLSGYVNVGKGAGTAAVSARFTFRSLQYGGVKKINSEVEIINTGSGYWEIKNKSMLSYNPRTDIEIICESVSGNVAVGAGMEILLSDL